MEWPPRLLTERAWLRIEQAASALSEEAAAASAVICRTSAGIWRWARTAAVIPALNVMVWLCLAMSLMLFAEKISMAAAVVFIKLFRSSRPRQLYQWEPLPATDAGEVDPELGCLVYPFILVQIPMFNEREVYHLSIRAACALTWPSDRLIIQVLDDSTDTATRDLVEKECERWREDGMNIQYISRDNRDGYKAGALREAMEIDYVKTCDYVAIFDADHQPPSDFLLQTIPFLIHNPDLALVQARWKFGALANFFFLGRYQLLSNFCFFDCNVMAMCMYVSVNADECLMTRIQEMSLNYHFKVEQESGSSTMAFFGFNGTAGVWRISAINEAKGWKDRTTVEDMDLAIRACLQGWKFVYVGELKVRSELPSTYKAYRYQQHRWSCGPANLFRQTAFEIMRAKKASIWRKLYLIYNFFLARRIVSHIVTFFFYCVVIPLSCFFPQVQVPVWGVILIPAIITLLNAASTPRSLHLMVIWIFFETVMSFHRCRAVFIGLLQAGSVNEWIVTEKLGSMFKVKRIPSISIATKFCDRFHFMEIGVGIWLMLCAWQDFSYTRQHYYIYVFPSSIAFIIMGCGYVGR